MTNKSGVPFLGTPLIEMDSTNVVQHFLQKLFELRVTRSEHLEKFTLRDVKSFLVYTGCIDNGSGTPETKEFAKWAEQKGINIRTLRNSEAETSVKQRLYKALHSRGVSGFVNFISHTEDSKSVTVSIWLYIKEPLEYDVLRDSLHLAKFKQKVGNIGSKKDLKALVYYFDPNQKHLYLVSD